jgi:hypothetical protein
VLSPDQLVGETIGPIVDEPGLPLLDINEYEAHNVPR